jgi:uncharacterized protein with FMN-binding domain
LLGVIIASGAVGIAFVVLQAVTLRHYRALPIARVDVARAPDGVYPGSATCGVDYGVDVTLRGGRIERVEVTRNRDVQYARIAETVTDRMVAEQTPTVDVITGATTSSVCLMRATEAALRTAAAR